MLALKREPRQGLRLLLEVDIFPQLDTSLTLSPLPLPLSIYLLFVSEERYRGVFFFFFFKKPVPEVDITNGVGWGHQSVSAPYCR